ncbi:hypothetical protein LSAT2_001146 [Lamellibrachia satsuma]|nr:hypothetical protein LSAT2_001146 [Lamellibrachia satsuma]
MYHDRKAGNAKPVLKPGDHVRARIQGSWTPATTVDLDDKPRSYVIRTNNGTEMRRNNLDRRQSREETVSNKLVSQRSDVTDTAIVGKVNCGAILESPRMSRGSLWESHNARPSGVQNSKVISEAKYDNIAEHLQRPYAATDPKLRWWIKRKRFQLIKFLELNIAVIPKRLVKLLAKRETEVPPSGEWLTTQSTHCFYPPTGTKAYREFGQHIAENCCQCRYKVKQSDINNNKVKHL